MRKAFGVTVFLALVLACLLAQAQQGAHTLQLTSSGFTSGSAIPNQFTCKGSDISPALQWSGAPANTASFAIIMDDPDAPAGTWVHWVIWNLPAATRSLPEGVPKREKLPDGARQGRNSFEKVGYNGPCPPAGQTHRYFFRLYALDKGFSVEPYGGGTNVQVAMQGHILAQTEYMGTFHK
jgi:Raf kinase inhibitor-like YbhB/YbcL family protein